MANFIDDERFKKLHNALAQGCSLRVAGKEAGVSHMTVVRYRRIFGFEVLCRCGDDSRHQGWCWWRYQNSPARQAFIESWIPTRNATCWPFVATDDDLVGLVAALVPKSLPFQVRDEVCQDICVAVLEGSIGRDELAAQVKRFITAVFRRFPTKYGPRSLDAPLRDGDARTLYDVIPA